ncbi:hypothetical protein HanRHA438_Chr00c09g0847821 [Helianthus annuus]|nr:hypothetical protein HanRHA438_Chr00c09g0847821 [Helianthus annuus]
MSRTNTRIWRCRHWGRICTPLRFLVVLLLTQDHLTKVLTNGTNIGTSSHS